MQLVNDVPPPLERLVGHRSWSPSSRVLSFVVCFDFLQCTQLFILNSYVETTQLQ